MYHIALSLSLSLSLSDSSFKRVSYIVTALETNDVCEKAYVWSRGTPRLLHSETKILLEKRWPEALIMLRHSTVCTLKFLAWL
jgi:hypothetical protein